MSDFGSTEDGVRFVELESPTAVAEVVSGFERRLRQAGWSVQRSGASDLRVSKDGRTATIAVSELYSASRIRIEYQ